MIKNNFRILKKPHANLQTIAKAPVKFQKDWPKTMGGVEGTRYLLKIRNHAPRTTHYGKPKTMSLRFSSKRRGTIRVNYNRSAALERSVINYFKGGGGGSFNRFDMATTFAIGSSVVHKHRLKVVRSASSMHQNSKHTNQDSTLK